MGAYRVRKKVFPPNLHSIPYAIIDLAEFPVHKNKTFKLDEDIFNLLNKSYLECKIFYTVKGKHDKNVKKVQLAGKNMS